MGINGKPWMLLKNREGEVLLLGKEKGNCSGRFCGKRIKERKVGAGSALHLIVIKLLQK